MDNWGKSLINWFTDVQSNIDTLYKNIDRDINSALDFVNQEVDQWLQDWEEYIDDMTLELNDLVEDTENFFTELIDIFLENEITEETDINDHFFYNHLEDLDNWFIDDNYSVKPNLEKHPACAGCSHYHGHSYGGNLLVCAMHPYGWENDKCPDWEGEN